MNTDQTIKIVRPLGVAIRHHLTCAHHCLNRQLASRHAFHIRRLRELEQKLPERCTLDLSTEHTDRVNVLRAYVDPRDGSITTELALILHLNGLDLHAEPAQRGKLYQQLAEEVTTILHHEQAELLG
jgi:hypothetical protein